MSIFRQPQTDGIDRVIYLFSQTNEEQSNINHISYFENEMAAHKPKPIPHLMSLVRLIC